MRAFGFVSLLCLCASGCATVNHKVSFEGASGTASFVVDQTPPDDYPGYLAGEGNIYGCRYGIHHMSKGDFTPPKAQAFGALLAKYLPDIATRRVVLERFDVYYNHRLKALDTAGQAIGGAIGGAIQGTAGVNSKVFTFKELILDTEPLLPKAPGVHLVGCDDRHEGEYDAAQISGGSDVIVTWLRFSVDGTLHHVRSFYQFQPETPDAVGKAVASASERTVEAWSAWLGRGQVITSSGATAPQPGTAQVAKPPPPALSTSGPLTFEFSSVDATTLGGTLADTKYSERPDDAAISRKDYANGVITYGGQVGFGKGSQWAGIGLSWDLLPAGEGLDASRFKTVTFRLAATTRALRLRIVSTDPATRASGCYPIYVQEVSEEMKEYTIPLSKFTPESWCGNRARYGAETLRKLTSFEAVSTNIGKRPITISVGATTLSP